MIIKRQKEFGLFDSLFKKSIIWNRFGDIPSKEYKCLLKAESSLPEIITVWDEDSVNSSGVLMNDLTSQSAVPVVSFCKTPKANMFTIWYDPKEGNWVCRDAKSRFGWKFGKNFRKILDTVLDQMKQLGFSEEAEKIQEIL